MVHPVVHSMVRLLLLYDYHRTVSSIITTITHGSVGTPSLDRDTVR